MGEKKLGVKHNLSLSTRVWGELKLRAFQENTTASELIAYILEQFIVNPPEKIKLSRYQSRKYNEGSRSGRTVYIPDSVWLPVEGIARQGRFSVTSLVDVLVKDYLGIEPSDGNASETPREVDDPAQVSQPANPSRYLKIGKTMFDLGDEALSLDLKTGRVTKR